MMGRIWWKSQFCYCCIACFRVLYEYTIILGGTHIWEWTGTLPPCWDNFPSLTRFFLLFPNKKGFSRIKLLLWLSLLDPESWELKNWKLNSELNLNLVFLANLFVHDSRQPILGKQMCSHSLFFCGKSPQFSFIFSLTSSQTNFHESRTAPSG